MLSAPVPRASLTFPSHAPEPGAAGSRPPASGDGRLAIVRGGNGSVVARAFATSPLRLLTPANHGHAAWIYTSHYGAGLVDGDRVTLHVEVGPGAAAFVSSQASTKVYRSPMGTCVALDAGVAPQGLLIFAPDPVVPFAGANYRQVQRFDLQAGGMLVVVDALVSGRCAAGERWAFSEYRSLVEVRTPERLLVHDAVALRATDGALVRRFGRFDVLTTILVLGDGLRPDAEAIVVTIEREPVRRHADLIVTASRLGEDGCIVRLLATSVECAARAVRRILGFVPARLGDDPWSRKW